MGRKQDNSSSSSSESESGSDIEVKPKKARKSRKSRKAKKVKKSVPKIRKFPSLYLIIFALSWLALFYGVVLKYANKLPAALTIANENPSEGRFIAERARQILAKYEAIGPKVVGSDANEKDTVDLLLSEIRKIRCAMNKDLFKLEIDLQRASGSYIHWEMVNMYQGLQNIVVKLSPVDGESTSYLLINTHFDSKPGSPGSGDPGAMVVVMLEVLRVLAVGDKSFTHPIIFLFNGAEENPLQGSHAFITQHKWAKNCKALINLDSGGSGGRDVMFQSGPMNPWIMKYYKAYAVHPFATTVAEEMFQLGITPSDTDFSIFKKFGPVPGVDIAHTYNGYTYHTEWDKMDVISSETLQNTGDNVLSLAKGFANASELEDPSKYSSGSTVFYDLLGQYLVIYTSTQAVQINYGVSTAAVAVVFLSICCMSGNTKVTFVGVLGRFILTFVVHVVGLILGACLPVSLGIYLDGLGVPLSYFTYKWMVIGLFYCPLIFGMGMPSAVLIGIMKKDKLNLHFRIQLILNSQVIVTALATAGVTYLGIKSSYVFMLATLAFTVSSLLNILTTLYRRGFAWFCVTLCFQIPAFLYFTYIGYVFYNSLIPMMGRFGPATNPDLYISGLSALVGVLALGFVIPLINLFRKPKTMLIGLLLIAGAFVGIALSSFGFPFQPKTNVQRFDVIHTQRVFYEADNSVSLNESGYYFNLQDRRMFSTVKDVFNTSNVVSMISQCSEYMFCGLPVFNHRWNKVKSLAKWLPSGPAVMPSTIDLKLKKKSIDPALLTVRYDFDLDGPPHMGIFIGPLAGSKVIDWTFLKTMLVDNWTPPYFIYFSKANDQSKLAFYVTFEKTNATLYNSTFELGIGGHFVSSERERSAENAAFLSTFPSFTFLAEWPASYERRIF